MQCYNEEEVLHETFKKLLKKINKFIFDRIIFTEGRI